MQLLATAALPGGPRIDATRMVNWTGRRRASDRISPEGRVTPLKSGRGRIVGELSGQRVAVPAEVASGLETYMPSFVRDVNPVLSRLGCNAGTCHGVGQGQERLQALAPRLRSDLRSRALTDDLAARRINVASPDDSLMLLKPTGARAAPGRPCSARRAYYEILDWIADGAKLDLATPRVTKIEISPQDPVIEPSATAADAGRRHVRRRDDRDVTREAFIESGNTEVATADRRA